MKTIKYICIAIIVISSNTKVISQIATRHIPNRKIKEIIPEHLDDEKIKYNNKSHYFLPSFDVNKYIEEDSIEDLFAIAPRFGIAHDVNLNTRNSGVWTNQGDKNIWKLKITSVDALSINLLFKDFQIASGAELFIYNWDKTMVYGPVTSDNNKKSGKLSSDIMQGETIILELIEPVYANPKSTLTIKRVVHGYKNIPGTGNINYSGYGSSSYCHEDVVCQTSWMEESNCVALILTDGGTRHCSGSLINNTSYDYTKPYFLTAFHCLDSDKDCSAETSEISDAEDWSFRFQYKTATCDGVEPTTYYTYSGATYRASHDEYDFVLVEIDNTPSISSGIIYGGWSKSSTAPSSGAVIHHPAGDVMKVSITNSSFGVDDFITSCQNDEDSHWHISFFSTGTLEGGSSGGPVFNQNHLIVGQVHGSNVPTGGPCHSQSKNGYFGRFDKSWNVGTTSSTRLKDWLDPTNQNPTSILSARYIYNTTLSSNTSYDYNNVLIIFDDVSINNNSTIVVDGNGALIKGGFSISTGSILTIE